MTSNNVAFNTNITIRNINMTDSANSIAKVAIAITNQLSSDIKESLWNDEKDKLEKKKKKSIDRAVWKAQNFR